MIIFIKVYANLGDPNEEHFNMESHQSRTTLTNSQLIHVMEDIFVRLNIISILQSKWDWKVTFMGMHFAGKSMHVCFFQSTMWKALFNFRTYFLVTMKILLIVYLKKGPTTAIVPSLPESPTTSSMSISSSPSLSPASLANAIQPTQRSSKSKSEQGVVMKGTMKQLYFVLLNN